MEKRVSLGNINFNYFITMTTSTWKTRKLNERHKLNFHAMTARELVCGVFAREFVNNCRISKISQLINIHHERRSMYDFSMSFTATADTIEIVSRGEISFPFFVCQFDFRWFLLFSLPHFRIHHIKFHCAVFQSIWRSIYPILSFLPFLLFFVLNAPSIFVP